MKKILLLLIVLVSINSLSFSQNRAVARGAEPGELYLAGAWYCCYHPIWGPPFVDTLRLAIYRLAEHGKELTIQYDYLVDAFTESCSVMMPEYILADATPGVIYNKHICTKDDGYDYTQLWVSFDYGKNWILREETGFAIYYSGI
jgi:hypothetical protein